MNLTMFIKAHRAEIDNVIGKKANDEERRLWILNDEDLFNWARSEGCKV